VTRRGDNRSLFGESHSIGGLRSRARRSGRGLRHEGGRFAGKRSGGSYPRQRLVWSKGAAGIESTCPERRRTTFEARRSAQRRAGRTTAGKFQFTRVQTRCGTAFVAGPRRDSSVPPLSANWVALSSHERRICNVRTQIMRRAGL